MAAMSILKIRFPKFKDLFPGTQLPGRFANPRGDCSIQPSLSVPSVLYVPSATQLPTRIRKNNYPTSPPLPFLGEPSGVLEINLPAHNRVRPVPVRPLGVCPQQMRLHLLQQFNRRSAAASWLVKQLEKTGVVRDEKKLRVCRRHRGEHSAIPIFPRSAEDWHELNLVAVIRSQI